MSEHILEFVAATNLEFTLDEDRKLSYKKGQFVQIESDKDDNLFVVYHDIQEAKVPIDDEDPAKGLLLTNEVVATEISIVGQDMALSLFDNVVDKHEELEEDCELKEVEIASLILDENLTAPELTIIMAEARFKMAIRGGKKVKVPVRLRKKKLTARQRAARKIAGKKIARNPAAKKARARSLKIRKRAHLDSVGYMIDYSLLEVGVDPKEMSGMVRKKLSQRIGDKVEMRRMKDGRLRLKVNKGSMDEVKKAVDECGVRYEITSEDDDGYQYIELMAPKETKKKETDGDGDGSGDGETPPKDESGKDKKKKEDDDDDDGNGNGKEKGKEGDACEIDGKKGKMVKKDGSLVCVPMSDDDDDKKGDE